MLGLGPSWIAYHCDQAVMGIPGVDGSRTETNHVMETWGCLGIEAARAKIIQQIDHTMASHGMAIDTRHMMLLADCMTYKVRVAGTLLISCRRCWTDSG